MRILILHNYYQHRGGESVAMHCEVRGLQAAGHDVEVFTLDNAVDLHCRNRISLAVQTVWSISSYRKVKAILDDGTFDVMHVHNYFPLFSPAVYDAARASGVPVVQTLHNYRPFCMQTGLFRAGTVCEECGVRNSAWPGIRHRCYRGSWVQSMVAGTMLEVHRMLKTWHRKVDAFIAVSDFVRDKYIENGFDPSRLFTKRNTLNPVPSPKKGDGKFFISVGRLSEDKGLMVLLDAWEKLRNAHSEEVPQLKIVGDGPLLDTIASEIRRRDLSDCVKMTGRVSSEHVITLLGKATASILPSIRFEPCSRTVAESYAVGTPVLAASIGGTEEMILNETTGLLFLPGDAAGLSECVEKMAFCNERRSKEMRGAARIYFEANFHPDRDNEQLEEIYRMVIRTHLNPGKRI